ncbi:Major facilitator superfamily general substrate transporter [Cordyceps militaris]|uniref:Major facilitator superfamily general substrate transporter n=1 Tax=Cordyceps militaris TaxID=73501 RepID=A0A2H4SN62_CORMI|nr:Major facilitator superfamily general substrate transporter [Cordyceps militaris]
MAAAHQAASLLAELAAEDLHRAAGGLLVLEDLDSVGAGEAVLAAVAAVVTPIPMGVAADRWGRRPFLVLPLVGSLLNVGSRMLIYGLPQVFSLRLTWLSASFELFTGGGTAFFAIVYTILTDVTLKAQRSTCFFHLAACNILAAQIGLKVRDLITDRFGPWSVLIGAFGVFVFATLCAFCLPETVHLSWTAYNEEAVEEEIAAQTAAQRIRVSLAAAYTQFTTSMAALFWHNKRLAILLPTLLVMALNAQAMGSLILYVSHRYRWAPDKVTTIYAVETISHFSLNVLVLPLAAHALLSSGFSARQTDTTFVRWGIVTAAAGLVGIGLAPDVGLFMVALVLYALINAYHGGILGLLSQLACKDHTAAMFATTRVLVTTGSLLSAPLFDALFKLGIDRGKAWSGLPYLALGCICCLCGVVVFVVTSGGFDREAEHEDSD